ncbi:hypothetical protein Tco_1555818 [Tanacetum coccineum]
METCEVCEVLRVGQGTRKEEKKPIAASVQRSSSFPICFVYFNMSDLVDEAIRHLQNAWVRRRVGWIDGQIGVGKKRLGLFVVEKFRYTTKSDVKGLLSRLHKLKIGGELLRVFVAYYRNRSGNASWRDVGYGDSRRFNSNSNMGWHRNEAVGFNPRVNRSYVDVVNGGYKRRDVGDKRSNDGNDNSNRDDERYGKGENDMQIDEEKDGEEDGIPVSVEGDDSDEEEGGGNDGEYGGCGGPVKVFGRRIVKEDGCGNVGSDIIFIE